MSATQKSPMRRIVSVERSAYSTPTCNVNIQYGSRAYSVHYNVPGQSASYYRTEYRPDNKMSAEHTDGDIKYWIVTLDNGARVSLALYLFLLEPQPGDEFEEYEEVLKAAKLSGFRIWDAPYEYCGVFERICAAWLPQPIAEEIIPHLCRGIRSFAWYAVDDFLPFEMYKRYKMDRDTPELHAHRERFAREYFAKWGRQPRTNHPYSILLHDGNDEGIIPRLPYNFLNYMINGEVRVSIRAENDGSFGCRGVTFWPVGDKIWARFDRFPELGDFDVLLYEHYPSGPITAHTPYHLKGLLCEMVLALVIAHGSYHPEEAEILDTVRGLPQPIAEEILACMSDLIANRLFSNGRNVLYELNLEVGSDDWYYNEIAALCEANGRDYEEIRAIPVRTPLEDILLTSAQNLWE